ncbi:MAG TPA: TetR/AcrR family transcriptional regulator [Solirubrobacteraceae bacterium]|nr:TetR/AcrR family transcriptional regulator [Solirubrobacteraceae bacterium]
MVKRVPRPEREQQMLDVALPLFATRGYHAVSVDEVAAGAGVTKPMVYAYFGSKEGLFEACSKRAADRLVAALEQSAALHEDPGERMWHGLLTVFRWIAEHREAWAVLYGAPGSGGSPFAGPAARASDAMARLITDQFADTLRTHGMAAAAERHAEPMAHGFVAATVGMGRWWMEHPEEPAELQALRVMQLAWNGIANVMEGKLWSPPVAR